MRFDHVRQHPAATMPRTTAARIDRNRHWSTVPQYLRRWRRRPRGPTVAITTMATATAHDRSMPRWQRSLLPAVLGADHADRGQPGSAHLPRSLRDWVVDLIMFGFALALGAAGAWHDAKHAPGWWIAIDVLVGLAACGALWIRRDHPLAVGIGTIGLSAFSGMAGGAAVVGMFTVAIYCQPRRTLQ